MAPAAEGVLPLSLKIFEHSFWLRSRPYSWFEAWLDLIRMAARSPRRVQAGATIIEVGRGEVLVTLSGLAERWDWTEKKVRVFLEACRREGQIEGEIRAKKGHLYRLVNYETYNGSGQPKGSQRAAKGQPNQPPTAELSWRVETVWQAHLRARSRFYADANGAAPRRLPALTDALRQIILAAIREHDADLLTPHQREEFKLDSRVRAAGIGLFMDPFMTGETHDNNAHDGGKRYLEPERAWLRQRGKPDPVTRFSTLYFEWRAARELAKKANGAGETAHA